MRKKIGAGFFICSRYKLEMVGTLVLAMHLMKYFDENPTESITKEDLMIWGGHKSFWILVFRSPNPEKLQEDTFKMMIDKKMLEQSIQDNTKYYSPTHMKKFYTEEGARIDGYVKSICDFVYSKLKEGNISILDTWILRDYYSQWMCPDTDVLVKKLKAAYPEFKITVHKPTRNSPEALNNFERIRIDWF